MDSCQQTQMDGWVQVSWQISPVHYGLCKKSYKTGIKWKDLWVLKGRKISSCLVSNKSNAGEAFLWFSEHCRGGLSLRFFFPQCSVLCKTKLRSWFQNAASLCFQSWPKNSVKNSCLRSDSEGSKSNLPWHMQRMLISLLYLASQKEVLTRKGYFDVLWSITEKEKENLQISDMSRK